MLDWISFVVHRSVAELLRQKCQIVVGGDSRATRSACSVAASAEVSQRSSRQQMAAADRRLNAIASVDYPDIYVAGQSVSREKAPSVRYCRRLLLPVEHNRDRP